MIEFTKSLELDLSHGRDISNNDVVYIYKNIVITCSEKDNQKKYGVVNLNNRNLNIKNSEGRYYSNINYPFKDGTLEVEKDGKWGIIDDQGLEIIEPKYEEIIRLTGDLFIVSKRQGYYGVVNKNDESIITRVYREIKKYGDLLLVNLGGHSGLYKLDGTVIIPPAYDKIIYKGDNLYCAYSSDEFYLFDSDAKKTLLPDLDYIEAFKDGFAIAHRYNEYGLINTLGEVVIEPKYDQIQYITKNRYLVTNNGKQKIIDANDKVIKKINPKYKKLSVCKFGYIKYQYKDFVGLRDANFNKVLPPIYDYIEILSKDVMWAKNTYKQKVVDIFKGYSGLINSHNVPLTDFNYRSYDIIDVDKGLYRLLKDYAVGHLYNINNHFYDKRNCRSCHQVNDSDCYYINTIITENSKIITNEKGEFLLTNLKRNDDKIITADGKCIFTINCHDLTQITDDVFIYRRLFSYGLVNAQGKTIGDDTYNMIKYGDANLVIIDQNNNWGIMDINGQIIVNPELTEIDSIEVKNDLIKIKHKSNNVYSLYDIHGKEVFKEQIINGLFHILNSNQVLINNTIIDISNIKFIYNLEYMDNKVKAKIKKTFNSDKERELFIKRLVIEFQPEIEEWINRRKEASLEYKKINLNILSELKEILQKDVSEQKLKSIMEELYDVENNRLNNEDELNQKLYQKVYQINVFDEND